MCYDFYSCPFEPDICIPPCGAHEECKNCEWIKIVKLKNYKCTYNSYSFDPIIDTPSIVCYYDIGQNSSAKKAEC